MDILKQFLIYSVVFLFVTSCWPIKDKCLGPRYVFDIPVRIHPAKDTITVGDTIWIECSFSDQLLDTISKKVVDYKNGNFGFNVNLLKTTTGEVLSSFEDFNVILEKGKELTSNSPEPIHAATEMIYDKGRYEFKQGHIAKKPGTYHFSIGMYAATQKGKEECESLAQTNSYVVPQTFLYYKIFDYYQIPYDKDNPSDKRDVYGFVVK